MTAWGKAAIFSGVNYYWSLLSKPKTMSIMLWGFFGVPLYEVLSY